MTTATQPKRRSTAAKRKLEGMGVKVLAIREAYGGVEAIVPKSTPSLRHSGEWQRTDTDRYPDCVKVKIAVNW